MPEDPAATIEANGWQQCALANFDEHAFMFDTSHPLNRRAQASLREWQQVSTAQARSRGRPAPSVPPFLPADYCVREAGALSIVVSQTCDVVASPSREPWVEVLRVQVSPPEIVEAGRRNSARFFTLDAQRRLVAHAIHRSRVDKGALLSRRPLMILPTDVALRTRFVHWLGRKFTRPALPNALNDDLLTNLRGVAAAEDASDLRAAFDACAEVRLLLLGHGETPPFRVGLLFITASPEDAERCRDPLAVLCDRLAERLRPELTVLESAKVGAYQQITAAEYLASLSIFLEDLTCAGEAARGREPFSGTGA